MTTVVRFQNKIIDDTDDEDDDTDDEDDDTDDEDVAEQQDITENIDN